MADGPSPNKKLKVDDSSPLPVCPYGARCYRKNPQHHKEFSHPAASSSVTDVPPPAPALSVPPDASLLPPCKYGASCYRKNLLHFAEFSHPTSGPVNDEDGGDTDVYSSEEDDKNNKPVQKDDILSRGMSLVKKFSQMTDEERKELIKKAFEEKLRLQKELENAKKVVAEKDKELEHLQKQLNNGLLMLEGEEEALKLTTTTYFPLWPERAYKEGSASQIHFRLAESQFYRLLTGDAASVIRVTKVEYVVSPKVVKRFREYQKELKTTRGEEFSYTVLGFHGTDQKNIRPICENGFKAPGDKGFRHKTDAGWYGAGVYFSEFTYYCMGYIAGCSELMLCQVLPGKVYECPKMITGASLKPGYDSHMSPCKKELVIFNTAAILPCYIIYFCNAEGAFQYTSPGDSPDKVIQAYNDAMLVPVSKIFGGMTVMVLGKMATTQANLFTLVTKHGGKKGSKSKFDILVTTPDQYTGTDSLVLKAKDLKVPIVKESYIYQSIIQKKKLPPAGFQLSV
ncbi:uncharacterized protein LOC131933308 [Physella acuta]|uniref:uncharacterized protein LOC131933308 n=1 Tax=Physella acuta TaxID=109671 RepID=UPI0027DDE7E6|nr:uncharacterized protein LOC131933308 [Physella acuta]